MAYPKRRTNFKRKRTQSKRKPMNISYVPVRKQMRVQTLRVTRKCYLGTVTPNTTATVGFWRYIEPSLTRGFVNEIGSSMGGLANLSEYQALFDQYKLGAWKITLVPRVAELTSDQQNAAATQYEKCYFTIIKDPMDTIPPGGTYTAANYNTLLENGKARVLRADRPVNIYMKPKIVEQYGAGANRYVSPKFTDLNSSAGIDVRHRGFHIFQHCNNFNAASLSRYAYDVFITYYLTFKGQK